jgi:hypothetical protein
MKHPTASIFLAIFLMGGTTMAQTQSTTLASDDQARIKALQEQLDLLNAQIAVEAAKSKLAIADLTAVKDALQGLSIPGGKEGTIRIDAGKAGAELLRGKGPLFTLLDGVAAELVRDALPPGPEGVVLVTEAQLEMAYKCAWLATQIPALTAGLETAIDNARHLAAFDPTMGPKSLAAIAAGASTVGTLVDTIADLSKLLRVDRSIAVFSADAEVVPLLGYLLEMRSPRFTIRPDAPTDSYLDQARRLQKDLDHLLAKADEAEAVYAGIKGEKRAQLDAARLQAFITAAKAVAEGLDIGQKAEAFWAQVKGQALNAALEGKARLFLEAKGQALLITESRWLWSDRIIAGGEIQVAYRLCDAAGKALKSGLILRASKPEPVKLKKLTAVDFSAKSTAPVKK